MGTAIQVQGDGSAQMFNAIAGRYDLLNRLLSLGMDRRWRKRAVRELRMTPGCRVLDLATGTADLAREIAASGEQPWVVGADPALEMLHIGNRKLGDRDSVSRAELVGADALALPFADDSFTGATIAFGIRNVPDRAKGLEEMTRVVAPGGRIVILELANPDGHWLAPLARLYCRWVVPAIGAVVSSRVAYRYLKTSMEGFPPPGKFLGMMADAGMMDVHHRVLFPGACHLFVGTVSGG